MTEHADHLTLPTAWRAVDADPAAEAGFEAVVRHEDLAGGLRALAAAAASARGDGGDISTGMTDVLAAAHVKVLSMLAEAGAFRTDFVLAAHDPAVRGLSAERAAGTWAQLTRRVAGTLNGAQPQAVDEHADTDMDAGADTGAGADGERRARSTPTGCCSSPTPPGRGPSPTGTG